MCAYPIWCTLDQTMSSRTFLISSSTDGTLGIVVAAVPSASGLLSVLPSNNYVFLDKETITVRKIPSDNLVLELTSPGQVFSGTSASVESNHLKIRSLSYKLTSFIADDALQKVFFDLNPKSDNQFYQYSVCGGFTETFVDNVVDWILANCMLEVNWKTYPKVNLLTSQWTEALLSATTTGYLPL